METNNDVITGTMHYASDPKCLIFYHDDPNFDNPDFIDNEVYVINKEKYEKMMQTESRLDKAKEVYKQQQDKIKLLSNISVEHMITDIFDAKPEE